MGDDRTYRPIDLKGIYPPRKHVFWCIGRWVTPFMVSWRRAQGTKNKKAQVSTSPLRPEDTPFGPPTKFCMWAKFTDIINCAKFHLHWLSRFWAPGVQKSPFPIDLRYRSYNSVGLTCYTVIIFVMIEKPCTYYTIKTGIWQTRQ